MEKLFHKRLYWGIRLLFQVHNRFRFTLLLTLLALLVMLPAGVQGWGFWAHRRINRVAVFTLPPEMLGFYKQHLDYYTARATLADSRRYTVEGEAPKHYIDLDSYGTLPLLNLPQRWQDAVARYSEDTLSKHGILPWSLSLVQWQLTEAFYNRDAGDILKLSADLGHYLADAHVPLHCTRNYNGQLTGQHGIHALWESHIPEAFGEGYDYYFGPAQYVEKPTELIWQVIRESYAATDSVLTLEAALARQVPEDKRYTFTTRGSATQRSYSTAYLKQYNAALQGMVERRMRLAAYRIGCMIFTAWVNAGQPDLTTLRYDPTQEKPEPELPKLPMTDREAY